MRKTSHDGGDSTSITSGVENEIKKSAMKPKKSSLKRKAPNFSQESDDTVIEPLLQRDKEKSEPQSAKYFGKGKTDSLQNIENDNKAKTTTTTGFCGTTESLLSFKDSETTKTTSDVTPPLHNYMNTNVFNTHDNVKANVTPKTQILVEIDSTKQSSYTPSPLIFTTAKIHTDAKTKQMEPVHVTPVPILSTVEVSVSKGGNITTNEKKISNGSSVINPVYSPMPLSKGKEVQVTASSFGTVISSTTNKDAFGKTVTVTSATKLANVTTAQSSSIKITLPSTVSNSLLMKSNTKDKQGDLKDMRKDQTLPLNVQLQSKALDLDNTKNDVTVKTIIPSSSKAIDISSMAGKSQVDKSQIQKLDAGDNKTSASVSSYDSQHFTSNNKTPTSKNSAEILNTAKNISSSVGNKQLQRQKTTTEEISNIESKAEPNIEHSENLSAKTPASSHPKIVDSISIKSGKLPNISANDKQSTNTTSSINNPINKMTPISTTTKPTVTSVAISNTVTISTNVSSKPLTINTISNAGKTTTLATTSTNSLTNVNTISTAATVSSTSTTKSSVEDISKTSALPTSIATAKCPEVTSVQPQTSITMLPEKIPALSASTTKTTPTLSSGKSKTTSIPTAKQSPTVTSATGVNSTQPLTNSTTKTTGNKTPSITTSVKTPSASTTTSTVTKVSSNTSQASISKPLVTVGLATSVKTPAVTTSIPKTLSGTVGSITTISQSVTSAPSKQTITAASINVSTKTPSATTHGKPSTANSSITASTTAGVKSPNNNSSQIIGTSKPSTTSIPKTESETTLSKTSAGSSSTNIDTASTQGTSSATTNVKSSAASVKKPAVTKTQSITTKSPSVSSANKSIAGTTTKVSSESSSVPISTAKKAGGTVSTKTGSVTTTTKTPSMSASTKTPDATSLSSTTSVAAIKPTTSVTQVSANKSVGIAGSSVPSTTPVLRPSESAKKGGSKSSENNKDGKVSKA